MRAVPIGIAARVMRRGSLKLLKSIGALDPMSGAVSLQHVGQPDTVRRAAKPGKGQVADLRCAMKCDGISIVHQGSPFPGVIANWVIT